MTIRTIIFFIMSLFLIAPKAMALGPFHIDFHVSAGKGSAKFEDKTEDKPTTWQYGAGATVGYKFWRVLYFGVSADYFKIVQTTDVSSEWGNRKGTRMNLASPTIGLKGGGFHLKYDYQLLGKYELDKQDSSGNDVHYEDPAGHRFYLGYRLGILYEVGLMYEKLTYETEVVGESERELTNKMELKQIGLVLTFSF